FMVLVFFGTIYSQGWTNLGNFPDSLFKGNSGGHGIAVDPDGKIWFGFYGTTDSVFDAFTATWKPVRVIHVFNADGTPASFSPIKTITVGGVTDTLFNSFRGMRADNNGNILYSSFDVLYRINYQTGEGMAKVQPVAGMTLTAAAVDLAGNVFVGPVIPGNPVKVYTSDFTFLGNVVDASVGFSRTLEVSDDGNTVYWAGYTNNQVHIYNRPDEFSPFELKDSILFGFQCESITWQPDRQLLWASSGSGLTPPNADTAHVTSWTFPTWYAWDPASNTIVDSMKWVIHSGTDLANQRPRGLDFSPDGQYAYVTCFGATSLPAIQKFEKPAAPATVDVTFQVDMSVKIATGYFNPATNVVTCPGGFNNWLNEPPANSEKVMTDLDNDSVYTITIAMDPNKSYEYKFNVGSGWDGKDENQGGNRSVVVGSSNMTVDPSFFNDYTPYTGVPSTVTFNVDMHLPAKGSFNPASHHVYIAGNFTDWGTGAIELFDADNDTIYSGDVPFTSGALAIYKFVHSPGAAASGSWETISEGDDFFGTDKNRIYGVHDGSNVVTRFWENTDPNITLADGNIFFEVDMSVANELGVFNPNVDSVQIRGGFNGWGSSQPEKSLLNQDPGNPNSWYLNIPFVQNVLGSTQYYKYFIKNGPGSTPYSNTGWEVYIGTPTSQSDRNRPVVFEGSPTQEVLPVFFEGIHTDWVIPVGTSVQVEFSVDMTPATSQVLAFNPATDTVYWIPRQPFYYAVNGLVWTLEQRVLQLTDPNADMIYTGTLTINGPSFNGFLYQYAFANATGLTQEDGSQGEARVRFIAQPTPRTFASPFTMPQDVWTNGEKPEESGPVTSVREIDGGLPKSFSLEQNYPNPFNPSTTLRFTLPDAGNVTLSIYNLLGEKVEEVLNQELASGSYEVNFDASKLSSGVYLYTIKAGNYTASKKMILMK
ncbi:MAG: hypothetical protein A2455_02325, partial [Ignavibacteria bacterium RIFOXYC2_FULL_35_16]